MRPSQPAIALAKALTQNLDGDLQFHRVGRAVNRMKNQGCEPLNPQ